MEVLTAPFVEVDVADDGGLFGPLADDALGPATALGRLHWRSPRRATRHSLTHRRYVTVQGVRGGADRCARHERRMKGVAVTADG
jgi:hypothetical protein